VIYRPKEGLSQGEGEGAGARARGQGRGPGSGSGTGGVEGNGGQAAGQGIINAEKVRRKSRWSGGHPPRARRTAGSAGTAPLRRAAQPLEYVLE
jgi:hypothetical protein